MQRKVPNIKPDKSTDTAEPHMLPEESLKILPQIMQRGKRYVIAGNPASPRDYKALRYLKKLHNTRK